MAKKETANEDMPFAVKFRDFVEQIAIAVVLALMFRGFEGEAFVIPTGSMAPTLMGMHKDIECQKCGYPIRVGAVIERNPAGTAVCQSCRFSNPVSPDQKNGISFSGDRIVVNKFAYQFWDPERWDVIVFKYPGNPKQNYIKRLVGLPGETLEIYGGDVYRVVDGSREILRKPPAKVRRLLQVVHDSEFVAPDLVAANWPAAWEATSEAWKIAADQKSFRLDANVDATSWLRYRHFPPTPQDWREVEVRKRKFEDVVGGGSLVTDYCGYNGYRDDRGHRGPNGFHWVGDLAIELEANIESDTGELWFDLVEAGRHHRCCIDVATGKATLSIERSDAKDDSGNGQLAFDNGATSLVGQTRIKGSGSYDIRFANVDSELILWVDNRIVSFFSDKNEAKAQYTAGSKRPVWNEDEPGDLNPARVGGKGLVAGVSRLRVLRDTYYVAEKSEKVWGGGGRSSRQSDYDAAIRDIEGFHQTLALLFKTPSSWADHELFSLRRSVQFSLGEEQYFPMGDNSPASKDARLWAEVVSANGVPGEQDLEIDPWVTRERLIGKAFFVYWPHPWQIKARTQPILPNVKRMGRIR